MQFSKVIGNVDPSLVKSVERKITQVLIDLSNKYNSYLSGSGLGGDPFVFSLTAPVEHICTVNIPTAATDGIRYFWNPKFVIKHSKVGLRLVSHHESGHAIHLHPSRRRGRNPKLWNIAVDYIVNFDALEDLRIRFSKNNTLTSTYKVTHYYELFAKELGRYIPLDKYIQFIKDPFTPIPGYEDFSKSDDKDPHCKLPSPNEDKELTPKQQKELERRENRIPFYFADPNLPEDMRSPEKIYDTLYQILPKCPECGRLGVYKKPDKNQKGGEDKDKSKSKNNKKGPSSDDEQNEKGNEKGDGGQGNQESDSDNGHNNENGQCPYCGGDDSVDIFGFGDTLDDHVDIEESEEKLARKIADAVEYASKMAGSVPASIEDELAKLTAPKVSWQDVIRTRMLKARDGNGKNDWTRFKSRPMFAGLLIPKRRDYFCNFACLLDTSGSMSSEDMAFGVSQLQSIDERGEGTLVCADAEIYWEQASKIKKCNAEELSKVKIVGRGGTMFGSFFSQYEKHIGKCDFIIVITDAFLMESDLADMKDPKIPVYWLVTSGSLFKPPFGKVMDLKS